MSDRSAIEWTDASWSPIRGDPVRDPKQRWYCQRISPGCDHCYASTLARRFGGRAYPAVGAENGLDHVRLDEVALYAPTRWRKPRRVFLSSMTDVAGEWVPFEWFHALMTVMAETPRHTYQVLTKRPRRLKELVEHFYADAPGFGVPLPNVWLGTSIESDAYAWRAKVLAEIPAAVRFVSAEPLLGPLPHLAFTQERRVPLPDWSTAALESGAAESVRTERTIDWLIVGGESGLGDPLRKLVNDLHGQEQVPSSRYLVTSHKLDWVRDLRDRAQAAGVAFFFKQWGGPTPKAGGRLLDGREYSEFPQVLANITEEKTS